MILRKISLALLGAWTFVGCTPLSSWAKGLSTQSASVILLPTTQRSPASVKRKPANVVPTTKQVVDQVVGERKSSSPSLLTEPNENLSIDEKLSELFLGGSFEKLQLYRRQLPLTDPRRTLAEIRLATGYFYNGSQSNYWFRDYYQSAPMLRLGATAWITPFFAVHSDVRLSMGSSLKNAVNGTTTTTSTNQWLELGFRFRRYHGFSEKSHHHTFGIDYVQYELKLPQDELNRVGLRSQGIRFSYQHSLRLSEFLGLGLGAELLPYLKHEEQATGINLSSGIKNESYAAGAWISTELHLSNSQVLNISANHRTERNVFTGSANRVDPAWGGTPNGVSVTNSFTTFELGFIWKY